MALQLPNKGAPPTGIGGDTFDTAALKLFNNTTELYTFLGYAPETGLLPKFIPITKGGTGANTAAEARANLGLGTAATKNVGTAVDDVMGVGAFGIGGIRDLRGEAIDNMKYGKGLQTGMVSWTQLLLPYPYGSLLHLSNWGDNSANGCSPTQIVFSNAFVAHRYFDGVSWTQLIKFLTSSNTTTDGNGFIKAASPIVKLFVDKIELNNEAQLQEITFEKLGAGDYLIKGSSGFAKEGWYVEQPKDANGNVFHAVVYDTLDNGDLSIKTYERKLEGVNIIADLTKPVDIKENRFISIRLHEEQEGTTAPINPAITDNEGNAAPSKYHKLEEGVWTISEENAAILEQERLAAMPALKRRQFRLALVMNGYDLNEIETLINQIEDPMQRTIAQIEWQDATDFERTNPTLLMMTELMQLTSEQVDQLWSYGLSL